MDLAPHTIAANDVAAVFRVAGGRKKPGVLVAADAVPEALGAVDAHAGGHSAGGWIAGFVKRGHAAGVIDAHSVVFAVPEQNGIRQAGVVIQLPVGSCWWFLVAMIAIVAIGIFNVISIVVVKTILTVIPIQAHRRWRAVVVFFLSQPNEAKPLSSRFDRR